MNIHNILLWLNEVMETSAPMVSDKLNIWVKVRCYLPIQPTHQSDAASNSSRPELLCSGLVAELWLRFCSPLDWGQGCSAAANLDFHGDTTISEIIAFFKWRQWRMRKVFEWTQHAEKISQTNLPEPILSYRSVRNQIASDVSEAYHPVHQLMTDKQQLVLINMLIRAIFEH